QNALSLLGQKSASALQNPLLLSSSRGQGFSQMLSRNYHILELGEGLFASSGLETAIRINPDPLCANFLQHRFGNNLHLLRAGHPRTVHIKDPQANGTAIGPSMQAFGQFSSLFGVLDGDNIRIEGIDVCDNVAELREAHVGVNLRLRPNATRS